MSALVVGLTGPSGAGKSTVAELFLRRGAHRIDCDGLARQAVDQLGVSRALAARFGGDILVGGKLNRRLLASRAFSSPAETEVLNEITHPAILALLQNEIDTAAASGARLILVDAPTLFESGADRFCTAVIAVLAPAALRRERIIARDDLTKQQADDRLAASRPDSFYRERAAYVMTNTGDLDTLTLQADGIMEQIAQNNHAK